MGKYTRVKEKKHVDLWAIIMASHATRDMGRIIILSHYSGFSHSKRSMTLLQILENAIDKLSAKHWTRNFAFALPDLFRGKGLGPKLWVIMMVLMAHDWVVSPPQQDEAERKAREEEEKKRKEEEAAKEAEEEEEEDDDDEDDDASVSDDNSGVCVRAFL